MSDDNLPQDQVTNTVATEPTELELAKSQAQEYLEGWQRIKADYANLKRESELRQMDLVRYANTELLKELLPLVDYFKHALKAVPAEQKGQAWVEGIAHIQSKLEQVLAYYSVKKMEVAGEKFNPEFHEAVGEVESNDAESGIIVEEVRTGFTLHDKVLQAARVKVAK